MRESFFLAAVAVMATANSFGQAQTEEQAVDKATEEGWTASLSVSTYLAQHSRDFANPVLSADRGWLHLEARYNYEALKTGSLWVGYNFDLGEKLALEATPMLGIVSGDSTGVAPGYSLTISYQRFELSTQGEYFFDAGTHANNFFYSWSELSYSPTEWFRCGLVVDRTKVLGSGFDVRRGPLLGFSHKALDFTTYWLDPGARDATFVFSVTTGF